MSATGTAAGDGASRIAEAVPPPGQEPSTRDVAPRRHPARERAVLLAAALVAVATPVVAALDVDVPGRPVLAVLFVLTVPGVPLAALLRLPGKLLPAALAVALSIATALLLATAGLGTGWWSPLGWAAGSSAVGLVATAWALTRLPLPEPGDDAPRGTSAPAARGLRGRPVALAVLAAAVALWWLATRWTDLDDAGATGVVGVVAWPYVAAVVLVAAVAALHLSSRRPDPVVLGAAAVVLALIVYAFVNVTDGVAGVPTGWLHVGFADYIAENQQSFDGLDARASWPAFFTVAAQLVQLGGVADASAFLAFAPFVYNVLAIPAILVVARCVTRSGRLAWLAVFLYLGANWVQQDYFAPQATAFVLYLAVLATLLWEATAAPVAPLTGGLWSKALQVWKRRPGLPAGTTPGQSLARLAALVFIAAALVVGHQLTPISLVITAFLFALTGYTRHRRLWLVAALLFLGWFSYAASDYWVGHLDNVLGDVGQLFGNLDSAVSSRVVAGDETYQLMQNLRIGWSLLYGLLALVGLWTIRRRPDALLTGLLLVGAGALVAMQSYGGEVMLRTFLFAAPILAPLSALALKRLATRRALVPAVVLAVVLTAWVMVGTAVRGVNVSFERVTADDVAAAQVLWDELDPGDTVGFLATAGAYGADRVGEYEPLVMDEEFCGTGALECALDRQPDFIVASRAQDAQRELAAGDPPGASTALADELVARGLYERIYSGPDAQVLRLVAQGG
ncbi:serine/threonine protein kinase [Geodermatophilus sp. CPCC 205761]|uniref:serine/threonine protein kinase n=1 Tax=Geodermatophilus sp. CPCC 205761 TaxID=2936597 RepID=UPI003EEDB27A